MLKKSTVGTCYELDELTMEWILISQLKYSLPVKWRLLSWLVCFLTNCAVLFRSFKSRILNMLFFFCYFLPTLWVISPISVRGTLTRSFKVGREFWKAATLLPVNNRDAWVLRTPVFRCEFVSRGVFRDIFTINFLDWLELWNATFRYPQTTEMLGCLEYLYFGVNQFHLVLTRVLWKEVSKLNASFKMPKVHYP